MSLKQHVQDLQNKVFQGQILEGFEQYYHDDIVMQENDEEPRVGKAANREYEQKFVESVETVHSGEILAIAVNEETGVAFIESVMDLTFKNGFRAKMHQVAVQRWQGDKVIHERFYHK